MTLTSVAKSTLTVAADIANATVTATYNGTTAQEGGTITNVPQGAKVTISVTPANGYNCTAVTGDPSGTATMNGSAKSWLFTMPAEATTVSATLATVTLKKIYFNNSYTLYGSVYAYVYDKSGSDKTYEYLGAYPGTTMTKLDNSNIWYIEVPSDVDYVEFVSGEGYTTEEMEIPWTNAYPKYTAPYGNNEHPTPTNGGTWGNYIYGSNNKRTNEYTVSDGSTMNATNLFTGITATMYDYYTDGEITASAGSASDTSNDSGWIGGIASNEYSQGTNGAGWLWNPYTKLNSALSTYANNTTQPKYDVTYPLYFGNLNLYSDNGNGNAIHDAGGSDKATVEGYYHWNQNANNSISLGSSNNAVTGLSGKTLANNTIHYYKSGDTNENGAAMAMFDEDFLSGENSQNTALATILRTSTFPVRKTNEGGTTTYPNKIYVKANRWAESNAVLFAHFYGGSGDSDQQLTYNSTTGYYECNIPSGRTNVVLVRMPNGSTSINWNTKWAQSGDLTVPTSNTNAARLYTHTGTGNDDWGAFSTDNLDASYGTTTGGHDYYEYDSTGGKDNAYITNINKTSKTANIDYYANNAAWSGGTTSNTQGFFPFDYANKGNLAKDLGFGMKLTIPFNLEGSGADNGVNKDGSDQKFNFSGDDDLWVFVDGKLVLDLGGAHARTTGSINFHTKTVTATNKQAIASGVDRNGSFADGFNTNPNYVHTMTIYYMERGMFESNLQFGFSFHAIPNQFWIDKKIRTKDIINAGFYASNGQDGSASNQDDTLTAREGRFISKFEASYQDESFEVTHKVSDTASGTFTAASGKKYTIDNDTNTYTTPAAGTYPIKHDLGNAFIGQFTKGQYFNLKEDVGSSNKYVYTPVFSVWDQANNNQAITATGDNSSGYTFHFNPTTTVTTSIENTNIKARFENYMTAHTLTLKKEITGATDTTTDFTFQIKFDFDYTGDSGFDQYIAYPLYCDVDGVRTQLTGEGKITVKAGQLIEIEEVPENAKVQVTEILSNDDYAYNSTTLTGEKSGSATTIVNGEQFTIGTSDVDLVVRNTLGALTITHDLHSATEGFGTCYASAKIKNGNTDVYSYAETSGALEISPTYIKHNSTYDLEITLRTVPANGATVMDSFWEQVTSDTIAQLVAGSGTLGLSATVTVDTANNTATITFPIRNLFDSSTQVQNVTNMPFYSKLATWKWRMIFDVLSYRGLYNNMQYVTDTVPFTESEWSQMTAKTTGDNEEGQTVDTIPDFTSKDARDAFIYAHAPYENGFKTNMTWNTALKSATHKESDMAIKIKESTRTITYIVKGLSSASDPVYVLFELPYDTAYSRQLVADKNENDDVVKTDHQTYGQRSDSWRTPYGGHYTISQKYVQAPQKILVKGSKTADSDTRDYKYFSYWEVYTQPTDKTSRTLYTKCYSQTFNLTLYQDSIIKAVYNNDSYVSPSQMALNDDNAATGGGTASINFMENSRTQWTKDSDTLKIAATSGGNVPNSYHNGGDRIYTDFLISFTYNDLQLNTSTNTGLTPGLIVETVGDLPINTSTGLYQEKTQQYYQDNYSSSEDVNAVKTFIANTSSKSSGNLLKSEFTLAELDNKNRLNYYYSLPNISHSSLEPTVRKNKVYRAYAYLRNASGAVVVSNPVYYSIYDIATIANYADGRGYDGVTS